MAIDKMVDSAKLDREMLATANAIRNQCKTEAAILWEDETGFEQAVLAIKGGGDINFEVVGGTTEPSNPKPNTIWVNTDTAITGWSFSATEPTSPIPGMVWVQDGTSSPLEFNALSENAIQVYPVGAKQYVSSTWDAKDIALYQDGKWIPLEQNLYYYGDSVTNVTGGWSPSGFNASGNAAVGGTLGSDKITMNSVNGYPTVMSTVNKINLKGYKTIECYANVKQTYQSYPAFYLRLYSAKGATSDYQVASVGASGTGYQTVKLPLDGVEEESAYVAICVGAADDAYKNEIFSVIMKG